MQQQQKLFIDNLEAENKHIEKSNFIRISGNVNKLIQDLK